MIQFKENPMLKQVLATTLFTITTAASLVAAEVNKDVKKEEASKVEHAKKDEAKPTADHKDHKSAAAEVKKEEPKKEDHKDKDEIKK